MADTARATGQDVPTSRRDLALDGATVALLMVGLLLPWEAGRPGFADTSVRVVLFLAALGVLVPHAVRWDGLALAWPAVTLVKVLLVLPLAVLGTGRAAALSGLADHTALPRGAVLGFVALLSAVAVAVQPRTGEGSPLTRRGWLALALLLGAAAVVAEPMAQAVALLASPGADPTGWAFVAAGLLAPGAVLVVLVAGTARRWPGAMHCTVLLGLTTLAVVWLDGLRLAGSGPDGTGALPSAVTVTAGLLAVAALLAARPAGARLLPGPAGLSTGRAGLRLLLVGACASLAVAALLWAVGALTTPLEVVVRLPLVLLLAGSLVLLRRPGTVRRRVAAAAAVLPPLATSVSLLVVLLGGEPSPGTDYDLVPSQLVLSLGLGVLTAVALARPVE